ncbi:hypothetical protein LTR37_020776 [Vermiconidia calcicola]|uniref:Uncharacterized protein n=1 Tax=Vermiconidia calcicola TaxID=1690605 RepID=A0ACC3MBU7_9PEZI|nr:hypothetical protein LTR37_020776 [Vermiconidia calcicola]
MAEHKIEDNVDVEGINYFTLYELPDSRDQNAPCILLVHALMSNLHMYDATVKALHAAGYSTIRYDHHKTTERRMSLGGQLAYHMDDLTRHMHQLVKARTGQSHLKAVVGCSIGGVLALRYAMMFPKDVDQVVSIAAPGIKAPEDKKPLWSQRIRLFEEDQEAGTDKLCHATVNRWFPGGPEDDALREESLMHVKACSLQGYRLLADTIRNYDYSDEVGKIEKVSCLVGGGTEDAAISLDDLQDVAEKIKGAQFVRIQGAGHLPPMHKAQEFSDLMLPFLGSPH